MNQRLVFIFVGFLVLINIGLLLTSLNKKNNSKNLSDKSSNVAPTQAKNNIPNNGYISAISNIDGIDVSLKAEDAQLKKMLKELGIFEPNSVALYTEKGLQTNLITVNELTIHLTDKEQSLGQITYELPNGKIEVSQSFGMKYDQSSKKMDLYLYLKKEIIEKEEAKDLSRRFTYMLRYALWDLTHPLKDGNGGIEEITDGKDEFMKKYLLTEWFNIQK